MYSMSCQPLTLLYPSNCFREHLSAASSYISLVLQPPIKFLKDKQGFFLALLSGLLLTFYSALYKVIELRIARASILCLRGAIQVI